MGSKNRKPTPEVVERRIKSGYGQGRGKDYKPWMYSRDFANHAPSHHVKSQVTGRTHFYFSGIELGAHYVAEYMGNLVDIREQFALLPWDELQYVAGKFGIRYPRFPSTTTPWVLTTDLVLSKIRENKIQIIAVAVKSSDELENPEVIAKLWLEKFYWNRRGHVWVLYTGHDNMHHNLRLFEGGIRHVDKIDALSASTDEFAQSFRRHWRSDWPLNEVIFGAAREIGVLEEDGMHLLSGAVWRRQIDIDLWSTQLAHDSPVPLMSAPHV